eukprot:scaffold1067_cov150-Amphora_coffeaeformis.AAC.3
MTPSQTKSAFLQSSSSSSFSCRRSNFHSTAGLAKQNQTPADADVDAMTKKGVVVEKLPPKPKRALNVYNLYFQHQMKIMRQGQASVNDGGTNSLASEVAQRWKEISPDERAHFQRLSHLDKERYAREMQEWEQEVQQLQQQQQQQQQQATNIIQTSETQICSTTDKAMENAAAKSSSTDNDDVSAAAVEISDQTAAAEVTTNRALLNAEVEATTAVAPQEWQQGCVNALMSQSSSVDTVITEPSVTEPFVKADHEPTPSTTAPTDISLSEATPNQPHVESVEERMPTNKTVEHSVTTNTTNDPTMTVLDHHHHDDDDHVRSLQLSAPDNDEMSLDAAARGKIRYETARRARRQRIAAEKRAAESMTMGKIKEAAAATESTVGSTFNKELATTAVDTVEKSTTSTVVASMQSTCKNTIAANENASEVESIEEATPAEASGESIGTIGVLEEDGVWEFKLGQFHPLFRNSPLFELNQMYRDKGLSETPGKDAFETREKEGKFPYFTSIYKCRLTGHTFPAGRLRGYEYKVDSDGSALYPRKRLAEQAAAARALDWFRWDEYDQLEPRLCKDDPLAALSALEAKVEDNKFESEHFSEEKDIDQEESESDSDSDIDSGTEYHESKESSGTHVTEKVFGHVIDPADGEKDEEDDEEEEYQLMESFEDEEDEPFEEAPTPTVEAVEEYVTVDPVTRQQNTPAQTLLQSLAKGSFGNPQQPSFGVRVVPEPIQEVKRTTEWVKEWVKRERQLRKGESIHTKYKDDPNAQRLILKEQSGDALLARAKSVLACLAQALDEVPLGQHIIGTQKAAFSVLELLEETKDAKPDADLYTLYLKCLDGPDGHVVADKADIVVQSMREGKNSRGYIPPPPNANTYNALIQLLAVPGQVRYEKVLGYFTPTVDTYWTLLITEAYKRNLSEGDPIFDAAFCLECINNVKDLSDTIVDDVELLNAPLRWSGGSKHFCRRIPWPDYARFLKDGDGFKKYNEEHPSVQRAREIQEWVESNPYLPGVHPNIESYEAVIEGWLRTTTRKGLRHAEDILNKLLQKPTDSPCYPRLQTFHPVLMNWLHSGDPEEGQKIKEWTDRIFAEAKKSNRIVPDVRIYEVAIHARLSMLKKSDEGGKQLTADECMSLATECSDLLNQFCETALESYSDSEGPIFTSLWRPFVFTMNVWQICARSINEKSVGNNTFLPMMILTQLNRTRAEFENVASTIVEYDTTQQDSGRLSEGVYDIVENSHRIYYMYASVLESLASEKFWHGLPQSTFASILVDLEGCVRKMGEFNELDGLHHAANETFESPLIQRVHADHFDYGFDAMYPKEVAIRRAAFPWGVTRLLNTLLDNCRDGPLPTGDVVRLCQLLNDVSRAWRFKTDSFSETVAALRHKALHQSSSPPRPDSSAKRHVGSTTGNDRKNNSKTTSSGGEKDVISSSSTSSLLLNSIMETVDDGYDEDSDDEDAFYVIDGDDDNKNNKNKKKTPYKINHNSANIARRRERRKASAALKKQGSTAGSSKRKAFPTKQSKQR